MISAFISGYKSRMAILPGSCEGLKLKKMSVAAQARGNLFW